MAKTVVINNGSALRTILGFVPHRDARVATQLADTLKGGYVFGGEISDDDLLAQPSDERFVFFRDTATLSNRFAADAGLLPPDHAQSDRLLMPEDIANTGLHLPFIGAFLPSEQLEIGTKLSIHEVIPSAATVPPHLQHVQDFARALKGTGSVLEGWTVVDSQGADDAATDLLASGSVMVKYGRGTAGQDQWTFHDQASYANTMREIDEAMTKKNVRWQDTGLVFERKLGVHDQLAVGQLNLNGQLISWVGRIDHTTVPVNGGVIDNMFTGSEKIFVLGTFADLLRLPLPARALEDITKAKQFGQTLEKHVRGGAITRINYNVLRGVVEGSPQQTETSGITEITVRGGGGSGTEIRATQALASGATSPFTQPMDHDLNVRTEYNGIPVIFGLCHHEFFPSKSIHQRAKPLEAGVVVLYNGPDPRFGFVRAYHDLRDASALLNDKQALTRFLYPNLASLEKTQS